MKVVIISDLHGNYDALQVLPEQYDELWVLGDLVNYGPEPKAIIDFVRDRAAVVVRGNHDHSIGYDTDPRCSPRYRQMAETTRKYTASVVSEDQRQFLRGLPLNLQFERNNTRFYLCHAKPSDPLYGYCPQDSGEWPNELAPLATDVVLVGHTHTPFMRSIGNCLLLNPGSLGQPKTGKPDACYAAWEDGSFQLRSFAYPVERTIAKLQELHFPSDVEKDLLTVLQKGSV